MATEQARQRDRWRRALLGAILAVALVAVSCDADEELSAGSTDPPPSTAGEDSDPAAGLEESTAGGAEERLLLDDGTSGGGGEEAAESDADSESSDDGGDPGFGGGSDDDEGGPPEELFRLWRATNASLTEMFGSVMDDPSTGFKVEYVGGEVLMEIFPEGAIDVTYYGVELMFAAGSVIPSMVLNGTLTGTWDPGAGSELAFVGDEFDMTASAPVIGEIVLSTEAGVGPATFSLPERGGTTVFDPVVEGPQLTMEVVDSIDEVWFPLDWDLA